MRRFFVAYIRKMSYLCAIFGILCFTRKNPIATLKLLNIKIALEGMNYGRKIQS